MNWTFLRMFLIALPLWTLALGAGKAADDSLQISITPGARHVSVNGDERKFREDQWIKDSTAVGVEAATLHKQIDPDSTLDIETRFIIPEHDYKLRLELTKKDVGFVRGGYTQYRHYFDNSGGFYRPFTTPAFTLDDELALDVYNIFIEAGLTLPNLPKLVLGYEYQAKSGDKSLLEWGSVTQAGITRKIYPANKDIDEHTDIFKVSLDHQVKLLHIGDDFRFEHYGTINDWAGTSLNLDTSSAKTVSVHEDYRHDAFFNTFHMDSHLNNKVYWSLGYLYSDLDGTGEAAVNTSAPVVAGDRNWLARAIDLDQRSQVLNLNAMFGPFAGLSLYGGAQGERTETKGLTDALLASGVVPATTNLILSTANKDSLAGTAGARFTKIPFTTLYAEGKWTTEDIDLRESQSGDITTDLLRDTDTSVFRQDYRAGFNTAPIARMTLAGRYRHYIVENDYDHEIDTVAGYPAFITAQDFTTDEAMAKLSLRPCSYFTAAFTYQWVTTDIKTGVAGVPALVPRGSRETGTYDANTYSVSATVMPVKRLYLTGLFSLQDTRTTAFDNQSPAVTTYKGDVYTVISTLGYALDNLTDLTLEYSYSRADYFTNNAADGLPLGLDYYRHGLITGISRKFKHDIVGRLRYGFYEYNESSTGGFNNYRAHLFAANCTIPF